MKRGSLFISIAIMIIGNLSCQFLWGDRGWFAYQQLQEQQWNLENQLSILERSNGILRDRLTQLQSSRELLIQEAGRLHYINDKEVLILTGGLNRKALPARQEDIIRFHRFESPFEASFFRGLSIIAGLSVLLLQILWGAIRQKSDEKPLSHIL